MNLRRFNQRTNAFRAKRFLNLQTILNHGYLLEIWLEYTIGSPQRKTAIMTKGRCFPASITLSHDKFLSQQNYII
jgi:hypothetical protein